MEKEYCKNCKYCIRYGRNLLRCKNFYNTCMFSSTYDSITETVACSKISNCKQFAPNLWYKIKQWLWKA